VSPGPLAFFQAPFRCLHPVLLSPVPLQSFTGLFNRSCFIHPFKLQEKDYEVSIPL
jgi:hypothetical protein